ncbi:MAG TPA: hypothetical protein VEM77_03700, partial [Thermoplasmata archaeon]|nr:hypothetical protein [Thermoplasmata archaeon]
ADQHEPGDRVPHHEGEQHEVHVEERRRAQVLEERRVCRLAGAQLPEQVQQDQSIEGADDAAELTQLEAEIPRIPQPPSRTPLRRIRVGRRITSKPTSA